MGCSSELWRPPQFSFRRTHLLPSLVGSRLYSKTHRFKYILSSHSLCLFSTKSEAKQSADLKPELCGSSGRLKQWQWLVTKGAIKSTWVDKCCHFTLILLHRSKGNHLFGQQWELDLLIQQRGERMRAICLVTAGKELAERTRECVGRSAISLVGGSTLGRCLQYHLGSNIFCNLSDVTWFDERFRSLGNCVPVGIQFSCDDVVNLVQ